MIQEALTNSSTLIWSVAELLRGDYKQSEYQKVVLPFTVLRRLDSVLNAKKAEFLDKAKKVEGMEGAEKALESIARTTMGTPSTTPVRSTSPGCWTTPTTSKETSRSTSPGSRPACVR